MFIAFLAIFIVLIFVIINKFVVIPKKRVKSYEVININFNDIKKIK